MTLSTASHLMCRLLLAFSYMVFALDSMSISAIARSQGISGLHQVEWLADFTLSGLVMFISIWLLFGLRSRVVAALGLVLCVGQFIWLQANGLQTSFGLAHLLVNTLLALPLLVLGGGRFALYRRGWQIPV